MIKTIKEKIIFGTKFFILGGFLMLILAIIVVSNTFMFIQNAERTEAVITHLKEKKSKNGNTLFTPTFKFTDNKSKVHIITPSHSSNPPIGQVGESIEVFYDLDDPLNVKVNKFLPLWIFPILLSFFGTLDIMIGSVVLFLLKKKTKQC